MVGLGGSSVTCNSHFFYNCIFFATLHYSGSLTPSLHKMGLGGVEVALPATPGNCGAAFCENTHGDG